MPHAKFDFISTDFVRNGFKPGYQIGLENFDNIFSTYTGQFITVTGIPSSGKSDFVDQMVIQKAKEAGVDNFSMIHDSFGCTAPDNRIMANAIRDAFCEIYKDDVLLNFANEMKAMLSEKNLKKFPEIPTKGNLD